MKKIYQMLGLVFLMLTYSGIVHGIELRKDDIKVDKVRIHGSVNHYNGNMWPRIAVVWLSAGDAWGHVDTGSSIETDCSQTKVYVNLDTDPELYSTILSAHISGKTVSINIEQNNLLSTDFKFCPITAFDVK